MAHSARLFEKNGASVRTLALAGGPAPVSDLAALGRADLTVLPLPVTRDGVRPTGAAVEVPPTFAEIFAALGAGALMFGGAIPPSLLAEADLAGVRLVDYYRDEELLRKNAYLTAEAAVAMATLDLPVSLRGARVAVLGSGRIARALCGILHTLGARIEIYARNPVSLAVLAAHGGEPHLFSDKLPLVLDGRVRAVFATVPAPVLDGTAVAFLAANTPIYDLWGGGVCSEEAKARGFALPDCRALPGRYSPESAADALFDTLLRLWKKEGGAGL